MILRYFSLVGLFAGITACLHCLSNNVVHSFPLVRQLRPPAPGSSSKARAYRRSQCCRQARLSDSDEQPEVDDSRAVSGQYLPTRRSFLASSAAALTLLPSSASPSTEDEPLERLLLGSAKWKDPAEVSPPPADAVSPSFATYLTRFLLRYDEGASSWWQELSGSLSLLAAYDARRRAGAAFGSLANSVSSSLGAFVAASDGVAVRERYAALLKLLLASYGDLEGARRHIGLLFATLPPDCQPVDALLRLPREDANRDPAPPRATLPPSFQEDFTSLLPSKYKSSYDPTTNSFVITPPVNLFAIGVSDESGPAVLATAFGPLSSKPLVRERPTLSPAVYALLGISGGMGCAFTHTLVIPLDVVKTRMQTDPGKYKGMLDGASTISKREGWKALLLGTQATIVGYLWYGISVYPSYAFFKRFIGMGLLSPEVATAHVNDVALLAGAIASVIASLGLTPIEACRIRAVAQPEIYREKGLLGTLHVIASEDAQLGWKSLYAGLPSLMTRQVIFGSVKFLAFERASEAIFASWPQLRDATFTALCVSLVAGGFSGALSSVVSQPADSVLTYVAKKSAGGNLGILDGAKMMIQEDGMASLFRGLGSRCVWAGAIIAGQFLLYDVFRAFFGITGEDLNQYFQIILPYTQ